MVLLIVIIRNLIEYLLINSERYAELHLHFGDPLRIKITAEH
jgi:hypothetical protein